MTVDRANMEQAIARARYSGLPTVIRLKGNTISLSEPNSRRPFLKYQPRKSINSGGLTFKELSQFIGVFNRHLYKRMNNNPDLYDLYIDSKGLTRQHFVEAFEAIPDNTYFYTIDINSAYWQSLFRLGYISEELFRRYMPHDEYKVAKRLCVSFLSRPGSVEYLSGGNSYRIICDNSAMTAIYGNVRNYLHNIIRECLAVVDNPISYNIDAITVRTADVDKVKGVLRSYGLSFKLNGFVKTGVNSYRHGNTPKVFVKKIKR